MIILLIHINLEGIFRDFISLFLHLLALNLSIWKSLPAVTSHLSPLPRANLPGVSPQLKPRAPAVELAHLHTAGVARQHHRLCGPSHAQADRIVLTKKGQTRWCLFKYTKQ